MPHSGMTTALGNILSDIKDIAYILMYIYDDIHIYILCVNTLRFLLYFIYMQDVS